MTEPWQDILSLAGFPTEVIVLDFETYFDSDYSIKKLSTVEFVMDSRFEVAGLGMWLSSLDSWEPHHGRCFIPPEKVKDNLEQLKLTHGPDLAGVTVVGQHLPFDAMILRERYGITPKYTVDVLDLARHLDARDRHDLGHLATRYKTTSPKGDTQEFKGLRWGAATAEQRVALSSYCCNDVKITAELLQKLLPRITRPEAELRLAAQTLRMFLVPQIKIDTDLGRRLIVGMQAELQKPVDQVNTLGVRVITPPKKTRKGRIPPTVKAVTVDDISKDGTFLALLTRALPTGESVPMKQGKNRLIPALAKTDEQLNYLLSHPSPVVRALMTARKASDSWPTHICRVQRLIGQAAARGGYMGAPLTYYAAHTGRYGGTGGTNFQNFGARDVHELVKQVGQMLGAPEGSEFGTGDLSQIEARVVAWFAGQDDLLELFRRYDRKEGKDIYCSFAEDHIYHKETRKPCKDDPPEVVRALTIRRNVGKETILGAGFGMGGNTFYERCKQKPSLKAAFETGELNLQLCQRAIAMYRQRYTMIPKFWQEVEKAFRFVTKYTDQQAVVSHNGRTLTFLNKEGTTIVRLPSGRELLYPHASVSADGQCRYHWGKVYGGYLAENLTQACARDVFTDGLLRLEDNGFNVLFHIHDAAIVLMPDDSNAEKRLDEMHHLQTISPAWAEGLPIAVEGPLCHRLHE